MNFQDFASSIIKTDIKKVKEQKDGALNPNCLFILDDVVKDIRAKTFNKLILNRRHIIQNASNPKVKAGCSIWITSQTYNLLSDVGATKGLPKLIQQPFILCQSQALASTRLLSIQQRNLRFS